MHVKIGPAFLAVCIIWLNLTSSSNSQLFDWIYCTVAVKMALSLPEQEISSVVNWFTQWRRFQLQDFMANLVNKAVPPDVDSLFDAMQAFNVKDKPLTMFQCQLKLFNSWFQSWSEKERETFLRRLAEKNPAFVEEFHTIVAQRLQQQQQQKST